MEQNQESMKFFFIPHRKLNFEKTKSGILKNEKKSSGSLTIRVKTFVQDFLNCIFGGFQGVFSPRLTILTPQNNDLPFCFS
jgi:hypothetical protein